MATNYTPEQLTNYFHALAITIGQNWCKAYPKEPRDAKEITSALWAVLTEPNACKECGYVHSADGLCLGGHGTNTDAIKIE